VWEQYRKILSGRVTYEKPSASIDSFVGYLKLLKDPKVEKLSIENLILRESKIKTSLWVYGLVVYPGMDSKVMKNLREGTQSHKFVMKGISKIFMVIFLFNLIFGSLFTILYKFTGFNPYQSTYYIMCYHFFMFSIMLPHLLFLSNDLFQIILIISHKDPDIKVRDYENLQEIGEVSYAMITNVGVLTNGELAVNEIVTESSIYAFDNECTGEVRDEKTKGSGLSRRRIGSFSKNEEMIGSKEVNSKVLLPIMNYDKKNSALVFKEDDALTENENFEIDGGDTTVRLKEPSLMKAKPSKLNTNLEPLKLDRNRFYNYVKRNEKELIEIIKALGLCHQAKWSYSNSKEKYEAVSNVNSEEILLKLVNYVGWNLMPKMVDKKETGITIFEEK
jgi:magnesium-transporting ATPase (P-type)